MNYIIPGFLFHTEPANEKLSRDDAKFVDVIHSAGLWIGTDERASKKYHAKKPSHAKLQAFCIHKYVDF